MRILATMFFTAVLAVAGIAQAPGGSGGDEAAIRVVQRHDDARNEGDWKALGALFSTASRSAPLPDQKVKTRPFDVSSAGM